MSSRLGASFVEAGFIGEKQLLELTQRVSRGGAPRRVASRLVEQRVLSEKVAVEHLLRLSGRGAMAFASRVLDLGAVRMVPRGVALRHCVLPVRLGTDSITIALEDPTDSRVFEELRAVTGRKILPLIALELVIERLIPLAYDAAAAGRKVLDVGELIAQSALPDPGAVPEGLGGYVELPGFEALSPPITAHKLAAVAVPQPGGQGANVARRHDSAAYASYAPAISFDDGPSSDAPGPAGDGAPDASAREAATRPQRSDLAASERSRWGAAPPGPLDPIPLDPLPPPATAPRHARPAVARHPPAQPVAARAEPAPAPPPPAAPAPLPLPDLSLDDSSPTLLIVEDDPTQLRLMQTVFEKQGMRVFVGSHGSDVLAACAEHSPDLVILDAMLPGTHGFDVCRVLKNSDRWRHVPVVMVSAVFKGGVTADARETCGADDFVSKPFALDDLVRRVRELLTRAMSEERTMTARPDAPVLAQVKRLVDAGKVKDAVAYLEEAISSSPLSARLHYALGATWVRAGDEYRALAALERACELEPGHFHALRNLSALYQRRCFTHRAVETLSRAVLVAPSPEEKDRMRELLLHLLG